MNGRHLTSFKMSGLGHGQRFDQDVPFYDTEISDMSFGRGRARGRPVEACRPGVVTSARIVEDISVEDQSVEDRGDAANNSDMNGESDAKLSFESLVSEKCFGSRETAEVFLKKWSDDNLNPLVKVSVWNKVEQFCVFKS